MVEEARQSLAGRNKLVEDNLALAGWCLVRMGARVRCLDHATREDLDQIARMALVRAATCYRPDRGTKFSTFAVYVITREVGRALDRIYRYRAGQHEGLPEHLPASLSQDAAEHRETVAEVQGILAGMDPDDRALLELRHFDGESYRAVAEAAGYSKQRAYQRIEQAEGRFAVEVIRRSLGRTREG